MSPEFLDKLQASGEMFVFLFGELAVLFLLISFLVALINQKLPAEKIQSILGGKNGRGYFAAAGLGAVTPFCSCSTIPMLIGLLKARAGFGALFIPVLGLEITIFYAIFALSASLLAGVVLSRGGFEKYVKQDLLQTPDAEQASCCASAEPEPVSCCASTPEPAPRSLSAAAVTCCDSEDKEPETGGCCASPAPAGKKGIDWQAAWDESYKLFKQMLPYMLIAMVIGAAVHGFVPADFFAQVANADNPAAVPAAAVIGIPLYMRVTTLMPLVGSFIAKGVSIGAIIALVIGSGGASLPELILLKRLFRWQLLAAFLAVIFTVAVVGGFSVNAIWG